MVVLKDQYVIWCDDQVVMLEDQDVIWFDDQVVVLEERIIKAYISKLVMIFDQATSLMMMLILKSAQALQGEDSRFQWSAKIKYNVARNLKSRFMKERKCEYSLSPCQVISVLKCIRLALEITKVDHPHTFKCSKSLSNFIQKSIKCFCTWLETYSNQLEGYFLHGIFN